MDQKQSNQNDTTFPASKNIDILRTNNQLKELQLQREIGIAEAEKSKAIKEIVSTISNTVIYLILFSLIFLVIYKFKIFVKVFSTWFAPTKLKNEAADFEIKEEIIEKSQQTIIVNEPKIDEHKVETLSLDQMGEFYKKRDFDEGDKLLQLLNEKQADPKQVAYNTTLSYFLKHRHGDTKSIIGLEEFISSLDITHKTFSLYVLGRLYASQNSFDQAKKKFIQAYELAEQNPLKFTIIKEIADCVEALGDAQSQDDFLFFEAKKISNKELRRDILEYLSTVSKNEFLRICLKQYILEEKGNDADLLFGTAYELGELNEDKLSVRYYKQLLVIDERDYALNNLGVAYSNLNLKSISNVFYKLSADKGNTLATSNYANGLIKAGFLDLAKEILEPIRKKDDVHENVLASLQDIKINEEKDNEKTKIIDTHGQLLSNFFKSLNYYIEINYNKLLKVEQYDYETANKIKIKSEVYSGSTEISWKDGDYTYKLSLYGILAMGKLNFSVNKTDEIIFGLYSSDNKQPGYFYLDNEDTIHCVCSDEKLVTSFILSKQK